MRRLICTFAVRIWHKTRFRMTWPHSRSYAVIFLDHTCKSNHFGQKHVYEYQINTVMRLIIIILRVLYNSNRRTDNVRKNRCTLTFFFFPCVYILSQSYNATLFYFDNISFLGHVLNQLFLPNGSSISHATYRTMVLTFCFQLFTK